MHNADIQMWHMCVCRWLYQQVIFKYPRVLAHVSVNLPSHSSEQAWCCIKVCSSVYCDEQHSFSFPVAMFIQRFHMCAVSDVLVTTFTYLISWHLRAWVHFLARHEIRTNNYVCNGFDCLRHATSWQHFELQRPCLTVALLSINLSHSLAVCLSLALYFSSMASHYLMGNVH